MRVFSPNQPKHRDPKRSCQNPVEQRHRAEFHHFLIEGRFPYMLLLVMAVVCHQSGCCQNPAVVLAYGVLLCFPFMTIGPTRNRSLPFCMH